MRDIQLDDNGDFRCAACGGKNFSQKRTRRAKVMGVTAGVATLGVAGAAAPLIAKKKLYCQACGTYNQMGNAQPYKPREARPVRPAPPARKQNSPKANTPTETLLMMLGLTAATVIGLVVSISTGSIVWAVVCGLATLLFGFGAFATAINMRDAPPQKNRPGASRPTQKKATGQRSSREGEYFEVKKRPPRQTPPAAEL